MGGVRSRGVRSLVEGDDAGNAGLVRRDPPLGEVAQLLHVLQLQERERVARAVDGVQTDLLQPLIGDVLQVGPHVLDRQAGDAADKQVLSELHFGVDRVGEHEPDVVRELLVEQVGLLAADRLDDV